jgi:hypothetical protein
VTVEAPELPGAIVTEVAVIEKEGGVADAWEMFTF